MQGNSSSAVTQQFTYMLMKTGTVVLKAETDMKGYTSGQIIQVTANIHNQSGRTTGNMAASLVQVTRSKYIWNYYYSQTTIESPNLPQDVIFVLMIFLFTLCSYVYV